MTKITSLFVVLLGTILLIPAVFFPAASISAPSYSEPATDAGEKGATVDSAENNSFDLKLRFGSFDPLNGVPAIPENLNVAANDDGTDVYIVQFKTQTLEEYRQAIGNAGGVIYKFLPYHSYLVRLDAKSKAQVEEMDFVRWVGRYEPAYKIEEALTTSLERGLETLPETRVNILVFERGLDHKAAVAAKVAVLGGKVDAMIENGFRMEATLDGDQLLAVAAMPEVWWVDRWSPEELDMDVAREIGGANHIETVAGYTGAGVRAEACDTGLFTSHVEFQNSPPIIHGANGSSTGHGTAVYGVCFADGVSADARGMMPDAQGIFAAIGSWSDRYQHTLELTQSPLDAVYQTNSWGNSRTFDYTSISAEMDDILFIHDIVITQSQSNAGNQDSRPQAWAKNIVSVGGIDHFNTLSKADDQWDDASIGPAADGRIKPDLCHFYDGINTTGNSQGSYTSFGGTSGATPIVSGHFGLFFQMWSEGIFGNPVNSSGTVFENRCHMTTAKAMMINQASSYAFSGTNHNMTRVHQGWGLPDLKRMHDDRNNTFTVNEDVVLQNLQTATYVLPVSNAPEFRATLVFADPMGNTAASVHRINDLTLKVTSPSGTVYWGNNGLNTGNWSVGGGSANTIDTVENVFVNSPQAGNWTVEVIASEINEDGHVETTAVDADFGLVVTGVDMTETLAADSFTVTTGNLRGGGLPEIATSDNQDAWASRGNTVASLVRIEVKTVSSFTSPSSIDFTVEGSVFSRGPVTQTTSLYNYNTSQFEVVDVRPASRIVDQTIQVSASGDVTRFVEPGTGCIEAELMFEGATQRMAFSAYIDYVSWAVAN